MLWQAPSNMQTTLGPSSSWTAWRSMKMSMGVSSHHASCCLTMPRTPARNFTRELPEWASASQKEKGKTYKTSSYRRAVGFNSFKCLSYLGTTSSWPTHPPSGWMSISPLSRERMGRFLLKVWYFSDPLQGATHRKADVACRKFIRINSSVLFCT